MKKKRTVVDLASRMLPARASVAWLERIRQGADAYLQDDPNRLGATELRRAGEYAVLAQAAVNGGDAAEAARWSLAALQSLWQAETAEARVMIEMGVKRYRANEEANAQAAASAGEDHAEWQRRACAIWALNPRMSKAAVAQKIDPLRADYIRKHISRPEK